MATWATIRNTTLTGATGTIRASRFLAFIDEYLVTTAGWTRVGSGGGTGSGLYQWGAAKVLPTFAASPGSMATLAWGLYQNASGAQVLFQCSTQYCHMQVTPTGGFVVGPSAEDILPTAPADIMVFTTSTSYTNIGANADQKFTFAYTTDHNSFIFYGKAPGGTDNVAYAVVKLEDYKAGDLQPYWSYCNTHSGADMWTVTFLSTTVTADTCLGWHPTTGKKQYGVINPTCLGGGVDLFLNMPVDPVSGNHQKLEMLCACTIAGSVHLRGKVPGLYRVSDALATGDRLSLSGGVYEQIVIGDYAVPWMSSDSMSW